MVLVFKGLINQNSILSAFFKQPKIFIPNLVSLQFSNHFKSSYRMFSFDSHQHHKQIQPYHLRKKRLFHQQIRKKQKEQYFCKVRQYASLPPNIHQVLTKLPKNIKDITYIISKQENQQWFKIIADRLASTMQAGVEDVFDDLELTHFEQLAIFIFLMRAHDHPGTIYSKFIHFLVEKSNSWEHSEKIQIFKIFYIMANKDVPETIQDAIAFHRTLQLDRFWYSQLRFYDSILKKYPSPKNIQYFFATKTIKQLSQHLSVQFYKQSQIKLMVEILVQLLYVSQISITRHIYLPGLFDCLEYYIGYAKQCKMLTQRCILLIYNINIDAGSNSFIQHSCFQVAIEEMKDTENNESIRSLLAESYLNAIINISQQQYHPYVDNHIEAILDLFEYIVTQFFYKPCIPDISVHFFSKLLSEYQNGCQGSSQSKTFHYFMAKSSLLRILEKHQIFQPLLNQNEDNKLL